MFFDIGKTRMKRKTIWKKIAKMVSWFKFFIEKKKGRENFVMLIIHIDKW